MGIKQYFDHHYLHFALPSSQSTKIFKRKIKYIIATFQNDSDYLYYKINGSGFNTVCKHAHYKAINKIIPLSRHTVECVTSPYFTFYFKTHKYYPFIIVNSIKKIKAPNLFGD